MKKEDINRGKVRKKGNCILNQLSSGIMFSITRQGATHFKGLIQITTLCKALVTCSAQQQSLSPITLDLYNLPLHFSQL